MSFLAQVGHLFSAWPGDLVYHLVVLFAIEAIVGLAVNHGRRQMGRWPRWTLRVVQAGLVLTFGRVVLMVAALFSRQVQIPAVTILPPLERAVDIIGLGLLVWVFVPSWGRSRRAGYVLGLVNPIIAILVYGFSAPTWYMLAYRGATFNGSLEDVIWGMWGLGLAGMAIAGLLLDLRSESAKLEEQTRPWGYALVAFAFVLVGCLFHLLFRDTALSIAGWPRFASFVAYPLLAGSFYQQVVYQQAVTGVAPSSKALLALSGKSWTVFETLMRLLVEGGDQARVLQQAAMAIAASLEVEVVAVGIPGDSPESVELIAVHRPGKTAGRREIFELDTQPAIKRAITRKQGAPVGSDREDEAIALSKLLGLSLPGVLWVEPIIHARQVLGVLIAGKGKSDPGWSEESFGAVQAYAAHLGSVLCAARRLEEAERHSKEVSRSLAELEGRLAQSKIEVDSLLGVSQAELERLKAELNATRQQLAQSHKRTDDLAALVQLQNEVVQRAQQDQPEEERWSTQQLSDLLRERAELEERVNALQQELNEARQQIAALQNQSQVTE